MKADIVFGAESKDIFNKIWKLVKLPFWLLKHPFQLQKRPKVWKWLSSVIHVAPFLLLRKPAGNYTVVEVQCHSSFEGRNGGGNGISYTRRLNFRYIMKLEKNCYEVCGFWSVSKLFLLNMYGFYSENGWFSVFQDILYCPSYSNFLLLPPPLCPLSGTS